MVADKRSTNLENFLLRLN